MLPTIEKRIPCLKCGTDTIQRLTPSKGGCSWQCTNCQNSTHAFTFEQMTKVVANRVFGLPTVQVNRDVPKTLRVFLEHQGPEAEEKEVDRKCVEEHVAITGKLPEVGKPLFTKPPGAAHPMLAIPYGLVVRVES